MIAVSVIMGWRAMAELRGGFARADSGQPAAATTNTRGKRRASSPRLVTDGVPRRVQRVLPGVWCAQSQHGSRRHCRRPIRAHRLRRAAVGCNPHGAPSIWLPQARHGIRSRDIVLGTGIRVNKRMQSNGSAAGRHLTLASKTCRSTSTAFSTTAFSAQSVHDK